MTRRFEGKISQLEKAEQSAIKQHTLQIVKTYFEGRAQLTPLSPRTVFVYGIYYPGSPYSYALWNVKVELKPGENKLILDNDNVSHSGGDLWRLMIRNL